jgi:exonuclease III
VKILSWNTMQGGGTRIDRILKSIEAHRVDTVALCEVSSGRTKELCAGLAKLGLEHCNAPTIPAGQRGVLIASKNAFEPGEARKDFDQYAHRWASVKFPRQAFTLVCTYFPDTAPGIRAYWPLVHAACSEMKGEHALLVGDLNSGSTAFDAERGVLSGDPWFGAMPLLGFTDLWRRRHRATLEHTWHSRGKNSSGHRIDHAFGSESLRRRVRECKYFHEERERGESDHSLMVVSVR